MQNASQIPFLVDQGLMCFLPDEQFPVLYRGQKYGTTSDGEPWGPINFSRNIETNRWTPLSSEVGVAFFGINQATCFLEAFPLFRERDLSNIPYNFPIGISKLEKWELITFRPKAKLKVLSLTDDFAYSRHRVKASIVTTTELTQSGEFSDSLLKHTDCDGILYRTRQGANLALVVFEHAKDKFNNIVILERKSFYEYAQEVGDLERQLAVKFIDDRI
ncbi:MAG: RES domain-containing protein [Pseudomonadota bacterium]|nr:RES domain-containing protein [Pseudomonadota bacterium]